MNWHTAWTAIKTATQSGTPNLHARLLDAVQVRPGQVYADWLADQRVDGVDEKVTVEHAA